MDELKKLVERVPHRFCPQDPEHPTAVEANKVVPCLRCAFDAALAAVPQDARMPSAEGQRKVIELACDEAERKGYRRGFAECRERAGQMVEMPLGCTCAAHDTPLPLALPAHRPRSRV